MAGPWEKYQSAAPQAADAQGPWVKYAQAPVQVQPDAAPKGAYQGTILPFSRDEKGNVSFDSDAGLLGTVKRAFTLPGDVYTGKEPVTGPDGSVTPEIIGRSLEFASTFSPSTPALKNGSGIVPGEKTYLEKDMPKPPTADALYAAADDSFKAMRETGVDYKSDAVKTVAEAIKRKLESEGFDAEVAGSTHRTLDKLASPPEGSVANIKGLHSARKTFGKVAQNFNAPADQSAASQAIRGLDEFIGAGSEASLVAGTPAEVAAQAAAALKAGNGNFAAASRSDAITGIERAADLRAAAANSGANTGNAIRQRIVSALLKPKETSGYSPEEIAALEQIARGTPIQNATRWAGNAFGGGGGLGQMVAGGLGAATGAAAAGAPGAAAGAAIATGAGMGSKALSNYLTTRALGKADEMIRSRSPLYEQMVEDAPLQAIRQAKTERLVRALLAAQAGEASNGGGGW